jgi:hypothetical protein
MTKVLFLQRSGARWPGANPELSDDEAKALIEAGTCVPYSDEARAQVQAALKANPNAESVELAAKAPKQK